MRERRKLHRKVPNLLVYCNLERIRDIFLSLKILLLYDLRCSRRKLLHCQELTVISTENRENIIDARRRTTSVLSALTSDFFNDVFESCSDLYGKNKSKKVIADRR